VSARSEGYASEIAKYYDADLYGIQKQLRSVGRFASGVLSHSLQQKKSLKQKPSVVINRW